MAKDSRSGRRITSANSKSSASLPSPLAPQSALERATLAWVVRRLGRTGHERRVMAIATTLFDLTNQRHELGTAHRRLLRLAALVHDVGRQIEDRRHPMLGAEMILEDEALPITNQDRRRLAYLTRYHRGAVPATGYDGILRPGDQRKTMRRILALLRAADGLDNRNLAPPRIVLTLKERKLRVCCFLQDDSTKSRRAFSRRKKFRLLEEVLELRVETRIEFAHAVPTI